MSLKLRELWNECEKMDPFTLKVFLDGLKEIAGTVDERYLKQVAKPCVAEQRRAVCNRGRWEPQEDDLLNKFSGYAVDQKPCVGQEKRTVCNRGRWEPQEDDLLHKCVTSNVNLYQGFVAFSKDPTNKKGRSIEAAKQRYFRLESEGRW